MASVSLSRDAENSPEYLQCRFQRYDPMSIRTTIGEGPQGPKVRRLKKFRREGPARVLLRRPTSQPHRHRHSSQNATYAIEACKRFYHVSGPLNCDWLLSQFFYEEHTSRRSRSCRPASWQGSVPLGQPPGAPRPTPTLATMFGTFGLVPNIHIRRIAMFLRLVATVEESDDAGTANLH